MLRDQNVVDRENQRQVHASLAYYYDHKEEIDASFADEDKLAAEHERKRAEYLNRRR